MPYISCTNKSVHPQIYSGLKNGYEKTVRGCVCFQLRSDVGMYFAYTTVLTKRCKAINVFLIKC